MGMAIPKILCHKDLTTKNIQKYANSIKPYNVLRFEFSAILFFKNSLRWPDTIYLRESQLFWNQIFSCSTAFDCWDILDAEKGMLEVYQKRTFIEIDTNIRKFSAIFLNVVFKENAYYRENEKKFFLHITLNRCWNLKDFRDQVSDKSAPHNLYNKRWLK